MDPRDPGYAARLQIQERLDQRTQAGEVPVCTIGEGTTLVNRLDIPFTVTTEAGLAAGYVRTAVSEGASVEDQFPLLVASCETILREHGVDAAGIEIGVLEVDAKLYKEVRTALGERADLLIRLFAMRRLYRDISLQHIEQALAYMDTIHGLIRTDERLLRRMEGRRGERARQIFMGYANGITNHMSGRMDGAEETMRSLGTTINAIFSSPSLVEVLTRLIDGYRRDIVLSRELVGVFRDWHAKLETSEAGSDITQLMDDLNTSIEREIIVPQHITVFSSTTVSVLAVIGSTTRALPAPTGGPKKSSKAPTAWQRLVALWN